MAPRARPLVCALAAAGLLARPGLGDENATAACAAAYEDGQRLRHEGSLREARVRLISCARDVCPAALSVDCVRWLKDVDEGLPSVVIEAHAPDGRETTDVRVFVDDAPAAGSLDGRAIEVDPGRRVFRFETPGLAPQTVEWVVREGEKRRRLVVRFVAASAPIAAATAAGARSEPTARAAGPRRSKAPVFALAGVGALGLASFAYFGATGKSGQSDLDACAPRCSHDAVTRVHTQYILADASLAVGVLALGAAAWLAFAPGPRASSARPTPTRSAHGDLAPTDHGLGARWVVPF